MQSSEGESSNQEPMISVSSNHKFAPEKNEAFGLIPLVSQIDLSDMM